jgi:hypothetical protein
MRKRKEDTQLKIMSSQIGQNFTVTGQKITVFYQEFLLFLTL